jgi:hypothetical protein
MVARMAFALLCLIFSETAHVGQLHIKKIELAELIRRSPVIVVAEPDDPPTVEERVVIKARGKRPPPYVRSVDRFRVRDSLRGNLAPGAAIAVVPADDALQERLHRDYHTRGLSRHVVVDHYEPVAATAPDQPRILFLTGNGERHAYTIAGGTEGLAQRSEVERLLGQKSGGTAEAEPVMEKIPGSLRFRFNAVALTKEGDSITLTVYPVWQDAQRGPPPGFEDNLRTCRLSRAQFESLYRRLRLIELKRYTRLNDDDFVWTPPDLSHTEMLHYAVDGRELVSWGREYRFLKGALRAPLAALERELSHWAATRPAAGPADFTWLILRDVQGLHGGRNVYLRENGTVVVQGVSPTGTGLHERRFEFALSEQQSGELQQLLVRHPPGKIRLPARPGIPDQARPEITLVTRDGAVTTVAKWDDDRHPDFDALYGYFLRLAREAEDGHPVWEGDYSNSWRPEDPG